MLLYSVIYTTVTFKLMLVDYKSINHISTFVVCFGYKKLFSNTVCRLECKMLKTNLILKGIKCLHEFIMRLRKNNKSIHPN